MTRKVGYGSPPDHSKWQAGQSGNPKGRPKGRRNFQTDLLAELSETMQITEGGRPKRITKQRALLKALVASGLKGNHRAAQLMLHWAANVLTEPEGSTSLAPLDEQERRILADFLARNPLSGDVK